MTNRPHLTKWNPTNPVDVRKNTNKFLEMFENGLIDGYTAILMCVKWMSEDDVTEMMRVNELLEEEEEDEED
jgi:hypothetical protein